MNAGLYGQVPDGYRLVRYSAVRREDFGPRDHPMRQHVGVPWDGGIVVYVYPFFGTTERLVGIVAHFADLRAAAGLGVCI